MNTLIQLPQKSWSAEQWFTTLQADAGTWQLIPTLSQAQWLGHAQQWQKTAQQYAFSKQLPAALQLGNMIQRVGEQLSADSLIAFAHWTFGNLYIIDQQASQALDHYRQAETLYRQLQDTANLARMNVGMVAALIRADQFSAARAVIEFTFPILEKSADPQDQKRYAGLANNAAVVYRHFADYDAAISLYEKKVVLYEQQPNNPKAQAEIARTLLNLGILKTELNLWEEAEEAFARSQKLFERADLPVQYHHDIERLCFHYASLASQRDPDAPYIAQIFMDARKQIHELDNQLSLAIIEAQWRTKMGVISAEFRQHLTQLRQQLIHTQVHKRNLVQVDLLIASQSEPDAAIPQLETLRTQNDAISDWQLHFDILRRLGEAHQKRTCLHTAQTVFEEAINLLETISQELPSSHLRTGFLDDKLEVYQDLAKLRLHQHDIAGALTWVERGRGRELLHLLAGENPQTEPPQLALDQLIKQIPADTLLLCYFTLRDELWLLPLTKQKILPTYNLGHCITP
ncbi:MAG TPA: tetratricopeptide repeat protein, partial [Anaerolineae bacterium]|nr:tetratricopeptide repeat protein [Anaerolineae bacterium]